MDTPKYSATVIVGGQSQNTQFTGAFPDPTGFDQDVIITKQSGELAITFVDDAGDPFDISGLAGTDAKVVPYGSAVAPTTLGSGVVSGAGNNIYTVTWVKDTIPSNYSTFPQDREGAIALLIELDEAGDDYFQAYTRFNVTDGDLAGDTSATPISGFDFTYTSANSIDWSKFDQGTPTSLNGALDVLAQAGKTDWGHVISRTEVTAPASPINGDTYVIAGIGGDWSTFAINDIVRSDGTTWTNKTPIEGDEVYDGTDQDRYRFDSSSWIVSDGDVTGPAVAVDDNICTFDSTTGKLIQDSGTNISAVTANTAKVTNATHTGDVTGDAALTLESVAVTGQTTVTADGADFLLISDTSDSGNLKKALVSDITLDLTSVNAWTGQQYFAQQTLADGANISWNLNTEQTAVVTLAGNRTLDNPTNMVAGGTYIVRVVQDGTGSRTLAYGANYLWSGGTAPTLTTTASAVDILTFVSDGTNMYGTFVGDFS